MSGVDYMPEVLRFDADDLQAQWLQFKQKFQDFLELRFGDLFSKLSETTKLDIFLNCVGPEAIELYFNVLKTKENMNYEDVIQLFDDHFASINELRLNFNQRNQENGESFDEFYTEIRKLVKPCKYQEQEEIKLKDRIVSGVQSLYLQQKLLETSGLTLRQAVEICKEHQFFKELTVAFRDISKKKQDQPSDEPVTYTRIIEDLKSDELSTKMEAVRAARRKLMVNTQDPFAVSLVEAGIIELLVDTLSSDCSDLQFEAAWALTCIAHDPDHISALEKKGAIPPLVEMVSRGGGLGEQAARALGVMAKDPSARFEAINKGAIAAISPHLLRDTPTWQLRTYLWACSTISKVGFYECEVCLPYIAELLTVRDEEIITHACSVLDQLTKDCGEHIDVIQDTPNMLTRLIDLFDRDSLEVQTSAVRVLGNMALGSDAQTKICIDAGFLTKILVLQSQVLDERERSDGKSELQYLVVWALTGISYSDEKQLLIDRGVIPILVSSLAYGGDTAAQAARGLGNIAKKNSDTRNEVLNKGALSAILPYMSPETLSQHLKTYVWAYRVMCRHFSHESPVELDRVSPGLPYIAKLLTDDEDDDVINEALFAISSIIDGNDENIDAVQAIPTLMTHLTALLEVGSLKIKAAALSVVGTMLAGNETQTERCLDADCLKRIVALMRCSTPSLVKTATWAASNIMAGTQSQIERALDHGMLKAVVHVLETGSRKAQDDAIWAINNLIIGGSREQNRINLLTSSVLTPFCALLSSESSDTVLLVLTGLLDLLETFRFNAWNTPMTFKGILVKNEVIEKVRELRNHEDEKVRNKAKAVCNVYGDY